MSSEQTVEARISALERQMAEHSARMQRLEQQQLAEPKKQPLLPIAVPPSLRSWHHAERSKYSMTTGCYSKAAPFILMPGRTFNLPAKDYPGMCATKACAILGRVLRVIEDEVVKTDINFKFTRSQGFALFRVYTSYAHFEINVYTVKNNDEDTLIVELGPNENFDLMKLSRPFFPDIFNYLKYTLKLFEMTVDTLDYAFIGTDAPDGTPCATTKKRDVATIRALHPDLYTRVLDDVLPRQFRHVHVQSESEFTVEKEEDISETLCSFETGTV